MPDFNFVQKSPDKTDSDKHSQGEGTPHSKDEGHSVTSLPEELKELPKGIYSERAVDEQNDLVERPIAASVQGPERTDQDSGRESSIDEGAVPPQLDVPDELHVESTASSQRSGASPGKSRLPLLGFTIIITILLLMSFIWFVNPYPPLRQVIANFLRTTPPDERARIHEKAKQAAKVETPMQETPTSPTERRREFDFFIQVSSWKVQEQAQRHANELKKHKLPVIVESEYVSLRRAIFFRVRIGPFESSARALILLDSLRDRIDKGAFIDSVRINTVDIPEETEQRQRPKESSAVVQPSLVRVIPVPSSGYVVQVSSFQLRQTAVDEASRLLKKGIPAMVTFDSSHVSWYRVMVGPFETRKEAQEYARIITVSHGNEVLVLRLGKETN